MTLFSELSTALVSGFRLVFGIKQKSGTTSQSSHPTPEITLTELAEQIGDLSVPEGLGDDLEHLQHLQTKTDSLPWPN